MKRQLIFLPIIFAALILAGCGGGNTNTTSSGVFLGGTEGLKVSFEPIGVEENGVQTIYDSEHFPLELILKNKGEETIPIGKVSLRLLGPPQNDFQNIPQWTINNKAEILKVSEFNPEGGEEVVSFTSSNLARYTKAVTGFTDINWNVEYAYEYKTHVIINDVCFKGDITDDKICEPKGTRTFAVSAAPIQVTGVEEDTAGKGVPVLKINLRNSGTGDSTIVGEEFDTRFSQVGYAVDEPQLWECKSGGRENVARFVDGAAQVICKLKNPLREDELYTKTIGFTVNYKYKELVQEKLRVKESVE